VFYRLVDEESPILTSAWETISGDPRVQADVGLLRQIRNVDIAELCRVDLDLSRLGIQRREPKRTPATGKETA
jgi:hypothetical protein